MHISSGVSHRDLPDGDIKRVPSDFVRRIRLPQSLPAKTMGDPFSFRICVYLRLSAVQLHRDS